MRTLKTLIIGFALTASISWGQDAAIQGVVTDSTGAVIPGATVTVANLDTGIAKSVTANEVGFYTVPLLRQGRYSVTCDSEGLAPQERSELRLEVGQTARIDFELSLGSVTEYVEVSAAATLIESETTSVGQVIDGNRILEMPLNGRNYLYLSQFAVGVLPSTQFSAGATGSSGNKGNRNGAEGGFIAVGQHSFQNNVLLDGVDNSSRASGGPLSFEMQAVKPPVDALGEFKVVTNNTAAEYGFRTGAKVLVSTKSGTNELHGSLYEFLRNDTLDGTNFFANRAGSSKPPYRQNQFGGTFGGPIIRNKMFFFGSYEGTRIRLGRSFTSGVPSRDVLDRGDFSQQPAVRRNVFDPLTLTGGGAEAIRQPFPNSIIPADRFDPVSMNVLALYPAPNISGRDHLPNNYFYSPSQTNDADQYDFRWDNNFNDSQRMFVRYSIRDQDKFNPGPLPYPAMGGTGETVVIDGKNLAVNLSSTLGASMHNEFRFGYSALPTRFDIPFDENWNERLGIKGAPGDTFNDGLDHGYARFQASGFQPIGPFWVWPNQNELQLYHIADNFLWQKGRHSLKFGGEYRRTSIFKWAQRMRRGFFQFNGVYTAEQPNIGRSRSQTGNGMADFMLGWANNGRYGNQKGELPGVVPYYGFFVQDDWKITPKLTLNLGLRWELFQTPYFPDPEKQTVVRLLTEVNGVSRDQEKLVFPESGRDCGCENDVNNFAPRLGLAYRLSDKTVIRTGVGIYYGEADYIMNEVARFYTGPPKYLEIFLPQSRERTEFFVQEGFPTPFVVGEVPLNVDVHTVEDFLPTLYVGQWFFDIQRSLPGDMLLTIAYNGNATSHLNRTRNVNTPVQPHPTTRWQARRIRPEWRNVIRHENAVNGNYQAVTLKAEKRFSQGFSFLSSFTWSHNIDYGNEVFTQGTAGAAASNYDISRERGHSALDRRLVYNMSFLYELPFGQGKEWLTSGPAAWLFGGWQVGGILGLLGGTPDHHSFNVNNQNNGGRVRGDWVRNPNLSRSERTIDRWFDTGFVTASAPGMIGNAGRNLIWGPGRSNFDIMVAKSFRMRKEGHRLQLRFESFNLTNTPHWGSPNVNVGTPAAGTINQADDPRRIQLGLKYVF